jgi:hypothetical protein
MINLYGNIEFFALKLGQLHGKSLLPFTCNREPEPPRTALPCWQALKEPMRIKDFKSVAFGFSAFVGW